MEPNHHFMEPKPDFMEPKHHFMEPKHNFMEREHDFMEPKHHFMDPKSLSIILWSSSKNDHRKQRVARAIVIWPVSWPYHSQVTRKKHARARRRVCARSPRRRWPSNRPSSRKREQVHADPRTFRRYLTRVQRHLGGR